MNSIAQFLLKNIRSLWKKQVRVIAYIDGFNLYNGLAEGQFRKYLWLNVHEMLKEFLLPNQTLIVTKYYTSPVKPPEQRERQTLFIDALNTVAGIEVYLGVFFSKRVKCKHCKEISFYSQEKKTDTNLVADLVADGLMDKFDVAFLVSGDTDMVPAVLTLKTHKPHKVIINILPPERRSSELKSVVDGSLHIAEVNLRRNQLPATVISENGYPLVRPSTWN